MSRLLGLRARLALLLSRDRSEARFREEIAFHIEMETARLQRDEQLSPAQARRRALVAFGGVEHHKESLRDGRGLRWLGGLSLDLTLGFRMLVKYPGLTLVGGLAFAFAIWVAASAFEFVGQVLSPRLPLPDANRLVAIENWDAAGGRADPRALHDFAEWRTAFTSITDLGAFSTTERNLITADGESRPIEVVEISASAFHVTSARALFGRVLGTADEQPGAPAVVVIGHEVWQDRFRGDPNVVGSVVQLGRTPTTIVGVMPPRFGFPVAHSLWVPLRYSPLDYPRGEGPSIKLFGTLAPGVSLDEAQAELTTWSRRAAIDFPRTHEHLRPRIMPYAQSVALVEGSELFAARSSYAFFILLVVLVCGNVALLIFARAASREHELVVRHALGASRARIVAQLFAEALLLCGVAAIVGLALAGFGVRLIVSVIETNMGQRLPFWFHANLSPWTVCYAVALTVLGAAVAGVLPGLMITRGMETRLRQASAGSGGLTFGGIWTALIVAQIAVTLGFSVIAFNVARDAEAIRTMVADFPASEFLSARIALDREPMLDADTSRSAYRQQWQATLRALEHRLLAEPWVVGVTMAERLPRMDHPPNMIQIDSGGAAPEHPSFPGGYRTSIAAIDADYFDVLGVPLRAGRAFNTSDRLPDARVVIVNESFVRLVLGGRNAIGRRIRNRYGVRDQRSATFPPGPWREIVGVVPDLGMSPATDPKVAGVYTPLVLDDDGPLYIAVHVRGGDAATFASRLRAVAMAVDPALRLAEVVRMDTLSDASVAFTMFWVRFIALVSGVAMLLSLSGIYAVMAFTVARRTREIGIRVALGASRQQVVAAIFKRPFVQVALGVAAGGLLTVVINDGLEHPRPDVLLRGLVYAVLMLGVCLLACIVPTWRALRVQPTEALRTDG